jgi:hypothetical protein
MLGWFGSISTLLIPMLVGSPLVRPAQVAPPFVERNTRLAPDAITIELSDRATAMALKLKIGGHTEPSVVVVLSGSHMSPAFVLRHTRFVPV